MGSRTTYPRFEFKRLVVGTMGPDGYRPPLIHRLLKPAVTGNRINGLGEKTFRRPRLIYHWIHRFQRGAFYCVQMHFYWRDMRVPYFRRRLEEGFANMARARAPVAPTRVQDTPENWVRRIREFALANEADEVGFAELRPEWIYEGLDTAFKGMIIVGVTEDGKAGLAVGVTDDLTQTWSAVDLVKAGAEALGGKGGGGRPDMAQAGGPDGTKAADALAAIEARLAG